MVKPIPEGFHSVTPSLIQKNSKEAIEFYKKAFDAEEIYQFPTPDGRTLHAMIKIGDSIVMMADEFPTMGTRSPNSIGGTPVTLHLYVENADKVFDQAIRAGGVALVPLMDAFWGDRFGVIMDPFGHSWAIATHKIDMTSEGLKKAAEEYFESLSKNS